MILVASFIPFRLTEAKRAPRKKVTKAGTIQRQKVSLHHRQEPQLDQQPDSPTPVVSQAVAFAVSEPVSEMEQKSELSNSMRRGKVEDQPGEAGEKHESTAEWT